MTRSFSKLNRLALRKLEPGKKIYEAGISFTKLNNGDGIYEMNIQVHGERIHRVLGKSSEGYTTEKAWDAVCDIKSQARRGVLSLPKGRKSFLSCNEAASRYLNRLEDLGYKDIPKRRQRLTDHLLPYFGHIPLNKISKFDADSYCQYRLKQKAGQSNPRGMGKKTFKVTPPAKATINRELAVLSHMVNKALEWGWIPNKSLKITRFKETTSRTFYLKKAQADALLKSAKEDSNFQIYPFIRIGLATGMRRMEIMSIMLEHIDFEKAQIFIPEAKAGARYQPMSNFIIEDLKAYISSLPADAVWLFPAQSKTGHIMDMRKPFRRVVVAAGLNPEQVTIHTMRHTVITHLVQSGTDIPTVQRISGHKTYTAMLRYTHQDSEHINQALDRLDERLSNSKV